MTQAMTHVQIDFAFNGSAADYTRLAEHVAPHIASVPGLIWKVWLIDETRGRAGGAYLFANDAAATTYLEGPGIVQLRNNPAVRDVSIRRFDVLAAPSVITHAVRAA